jgi:acetyl esterase/lipase
MRQQYGQSRLGRIPIVAALIAGSSAWAFRQDQRPDRQPSDPTQRRVVYALPGMDRVEVRRGVTYRPVDGDSLKMDVYAPRGLPAGARRPAVIFIHGGPIAAGMQPQEWGAYRSYGELVAASGLIAVAFKHRLYGAGSYDRAASDVEALVDYVRSHAADLRIDPERLAVWAFSGGGPLLSFAFQAPPPYLRCIVSYYAPLDLRRAPADLFGTAIPKTTAERFSVVGLASKAGGRVPPILIARAGRDSPWINDSVDEFLRTAFAKGLTVDLMTHPQGHHAFDILDADERSREIIRRTIEYLKDHLTAGEAGPPR